MYNTQSTRARERAHSCTYIAPAPSLLLLLLRCVIMNACRRRRRRLNVYASADTNRRTKQPHRQRAARVCTRASKHTAAATASRTIS